MQDAVDWALLHKPGVVTMPHSFAFAVRRGELTAEGEAAISRLLSEEYTLERTGFLRVWVRNKTVLRAEALLRGIRVPRADRARLRSGEDPLRRVSYARDVAVPTA